MALDFGDNFVQTANLYLTDIEFLRGGVKPAVNQLSDLNIYQDDDSVTGKSSSVKDFSMMVYVKNANDSETANDGDSTQGWWWYSGVDTTVDQGWVRLIGSDIGTSVLLRDGDGTDTDSDTTHVQFLGGSGMKAFDFTNTTNPVFELTASIDDTDLSAGVIPMWDDAGGTAANAHFTTSGLTYDTADGYSFSGSGGADDVTIDGDLTVAGTLTAATTVATANISTSDTFFRLADPSSFVQVGTGDAAETEYENARNAGLIVNTGYYDDNPSDDGTGGDPADPAYSRHAILYWDKTFREWLLRDGTPNGGAADASDRFEGAESNFINASSHYIRNFYASEKEIHFGLDAVYSFDLTSGSNNPGSVTAGALSAQKNRYLPTLSSMKEWQAFFSPSSDEANFYSNFGWTDDIASDANVANQMADTHVRFARVIKAKVDLEGGDVQNVGAANSGFKKIHVYHGGIFGSDFIPVVRCYALKSGTEGVNGSAVYEEIIVNVTQKYGDAFVEITFNEGYLTTTDGQAGNILHVRMVG